MVQLRDEVVGVDAAIIMSPRVWEASGHVAGFSDPLIECLECHHRFREDHLEPNAEGVRTCPDCGNTAFSDVKRFNLMFKTHMGPVEDDAAVVYLRPETAQGMFVDYRTIQQTSRLKIPFGIAQIGKSFRNEITPGNFIFRTREFEQMEMEFFVEPGTDEKWFDYWLDERFRWYVGLGIREEKLRLRPHEPDELAHYAKAATDVEYEFPFGWSELEGIANRQDFDLRQHQEFSGEDLTYFDAETERRYLPFVVEPAAGVDRTLLAFLVDAYRRRRRPRRRARWRSGRCCGCIRRSPRSRWPSFPCRGTRRSCPRPVGSTTSSGAGG
jgi:glycyl-tRNA synthetase